MTASAWADLWSDALSWLQVTSVLPKLKEFMKRHTIFWQRGRYLHGIWLAERPRTTILLKRDHSFGEMLDEAHFSCRCLMLKSDKIWCAYLVVNCVSLGTFWTPLVAFIRVRPHGARDRLKTDATDGARFIDWHEALVHDIARLMPETNNGRTCRASRQLLCNPGCMKSINNWPHIVRRQRRTQEGADGAKAPSEIPRKKYWLKCSMFPRFNWLIEPTFGHLY